MRGVNSFSYPLHKDRRRYQVARAVIAGEFSLDHACRALGKSARQMRRIVERVKREGEGGVMHKLRGRASNRQLSNDVKCAVLKIYTKSCKRLGLTAAKNHIWRQSKIRINRETLRRWLIAAGLRPGRGESRSPVSRLVIFSAPYTSK